MSMLEVEQQLRLELERLSARQVPEVVGMEVDGQDLRVSGVPARGVHVWLRGSAALTELRVARSSYEARERLARLMLPDSFMEATSALLSWQSRGGTRYRLGDRVRHRGGPMKWGTLAGFYPQGDGSCEFWVHRDDPWPGSDPYYWWGTHHIDEHRPVAQGTSGPAGESTP